MNLDLTDDEAAALIRELTDITWNDRYPLSPRIRVLEEILGMLRRAWRRPGFDHVLSRGGSRLRLVLAAQVALSGGSGSGTAWLLKLQEFFWRSSKLRA
jgi:hypothetical protein